MDYNNRIFHNSTIEKYRTPLGAMATGQKVVLRLEAYQVPVSAAKVSVIDGNQTIDYRMTSREDMWQAEISLPAHPCVLWYYFTVQVQGQDLYYGPKYGRTCGQGEISFSPQGSFELVVYDAAFETPKKLWKSIMYQIFPDRFAKGNPEQALEGVEYHRKMGRNAIVHESFEEEPGYLPLEGKQFYEPCDYFLGDLAGIEQNLTYLASLGVDLIYLNPIFEADSNHRYNTADYGKVDPILGTNQQFHQLTQKARELGMQIILDGVFSHTGADSIYFNKKANYPHKGAYQGEESPYYSWYQFSQFPDQYRSWWGFDTLPEVNEMDAQWQDYIISGDESIMKYWLRMGAAGYRLDVADELPDEVIELMRKAIKGENPDSFLLGEVWEDATTKQAYGKHRTYALGRGLDSVMNYPLRNAIVDFLCFHTSSWDLKNLLLTQATNYPKPMYHVLMNLLSSHDIIRVRTALATQVNPQGMSREKQAKFLVTEQQEKRGAMLQKLAATLQFTLPGIPAIYYGDEVGMHGLLDPFNRKPYQVRDQEMRGFYQKLARIRKNADALSIGEIGVFTPTEHVIGILRLLTESEDGANAYLVLINRQEQEQLLAIDLYGICEGLQESAIQRLRQVSLKRATCELSGQTYEIQEGILEVKIEGCSALLFRLT